MPRSDAFLDIGRLVLDDTRPRKHVTGTAVEVEEWEHRSDRSYDQQDPSTIFVFSGGRRLPPICTYDRELATAIARIVIVDSLTQPSTGHHPVVYDHPFRRNQETVRGRP